MIGITMNAKNCFGVHLLAAAGCFIAMVPSQQARP
jgi:hypothetical protein